MKIDQMNLVSFNPTRKATSSLKNNVSVPQNLSGFRVAQPLNLAQSQMIKNSAISPLQGISRVSFTGNFNKNPRQLASISAEYQKLLDDNKMYKIGGEGNVAMEAADAFAAKGMDVRTFCPYYSPDNAKGKMQVMTPKEGAPGEYTFRAANPDEKLEAGESFVLRSFDQTVTPKDAAKKYVLLERVEGVSGKVKSINELANGMDEIPYQLFKVKDRPDICGVAGKPQEIYIVHTPGTAKFIRAYNSGADSSGGAYGGGHFADLQYSIFSRATIAAIKQLSEKEGTEKFNPASLWLHDRQAFVASSVIAEESSRGDQYWDGIKTDSRFHNPGKTYQGGYEDPVDFFRIIASEEDFNTLKSNKESYDFVTRMTQKVQDERKRKGTDKDKQFATNKILTQEEFKKLQDIFEPLIGQFRDESGLYNMCKIPVVAKKLNPYNTELGTVSVNYGREMKNHNTPEIAQDLTREFASLKTTDITNGSSAASLGLDKIGNFGPAGNGFTDEVKAGFTPLTKDIIGDKDSLHTAKRSNAQWYINTVAKASKEGNNALARLMFDVDAEFSKIVTSLIANKLINGDIKDITAELKKIESSEGKTNYLVTLASQPGNGEAIAKEIDKNLPTVLGGLSEYQEGDKLFIGWGRPDTQKGFPTTLEAFAQIFEDKNISPEVKKHIKLVAGAGVWEKPAQDWADIQALMKRIQTIDGGKYKNNVVYVNGFFANRTVACADYSIITSRYEPCGITPLESYAGGTPVISINTGGSPDFITPYDGTNADKATGFLTKHAYLVSAEAIGAKAGLGYRELDEARRKALGAEAADCIKQAIGIDNEQYKQMALNCTRQPIGWSENAAFNGGKAADERYIGDVFNLDSKNGFAQIGGMERNTGKLVKLTGSSVSSTTDSGSKVIVTENYTIPEDRKTTATLDQF